MNASLLQRTSRSLSATGLLCAGVLITAQVAPAVTYIFGSDNDGLAGFTQSASSATEIWSTETDNVQYANQNSGTVNSSLLRDFTLDRTIGNTYSIEGVISLIDGYADDNNRVGIYLFGDSAVVPNEDEAGAIGLIFNMDDNVVGGAPGDNADDNIALRVGIDSTNLSGNTSRNEATTEFAQDLFGTTITLTAIVSFFNDGLDDRILIDATLTDASGDETTTSISVLAADYTGDYFGFVTRARARNFPDTAANRGAPWVMGYESFSVSLIPEPSTGLVALVGGALMLIRRRSRRS